MRIRPNVPISIQVANDLRRRLRQDSFADERLPGENVLAAELGVSRGTVRQALTILEHEGAVSRYQGRGTFVNRHVMGIQARVDVAYEFSHLIEAGGYMPAIKLLGLHDTVAGLDTARRLGIAPDAPCLDIRKLFLASGQPAVYVHEYVPTAIILERYDSAELAAPIFRFIEQRCRTRVDYILSEIIPYLARGDAAARLEVEAGSALLKFVEVFYSSANKPLVLADIYFRDPLIRFHALRKMSRIS